MTSSPQYKSFEDIDWATWKPREHATLLFIVRDDEILLIRKKRGLGAGKINGPGGRLDPGETPMQCAIREVQEELCVTPTGVEQCGELLFQFVDGLSMYGYVFIATGFDGTPTETDEAIPMWTPVDSIPYDQMWQDDKFWVPWMLEGRKFEGRMLFDGDAIVGQEFAVVPDDHVWHEYVH